MMYLLIYQNFPLKITVKMPTEGWDDPIWGSILRKCLFYLLSVFYFVQKCGRALLQSSSNFTSLGSIKTPAWFLQWFLVDSI